MVGEYFKMSKAGYHIFLFHATDVSLCQIILMDYLVLVKQAKKIWRHLKLPTVFF